MSRVQEQDSIDLAPAGGRHVEEQKRPRPAALPRAGRRRGRRRRRAGDRRPGRAGAGGHGPDRAAEHGHQPAARFRPGRRAERLFLGSGRHRGRSVVQWPGAAERPHPAPVDRGAVGRGPGLERVGRYLVWSDIPNNRQMRWIEDDGHVSVFRMPSNNSNGNTFDFQGRQISCEHLTRRVVRYELDGSITVLAEFLERQAAQLAQRRGPASGRQHLVHRPALWRPALRRHPRSRRRQEQPGGQAQQPGRSARRGQRYEAGAAHPGLSVGPERPPRRGDPRRQGAEPQRPVLLARLQEAVRRQHGTGRQGRHPCPRRRSDNKLSNQKVFTDCMVDGVKCGPDGVRCDVFGNLWASSNAGRNVGYSGVTVWSPDGKLLGRIRHARGLRQRLLRRPQAQPAVHGRQPVALRRLHRDPGRGARLIPPRA